VGIPGIGRVAGWVTGLRVAVKIAVLPTLMLVPLLFVGHSYLSLQNQTISVAQREQRGVAYLRASYSLLLDVDRVRDGAGSPDTVAADLAALDRITPAASRAMPALPGAEALTLALSQTESAVAAAGHADPSQRQAAWDAASSAVTNLILQDSNDSTLVLDPQLDSYYTMDAVMNRATTIVDQAGKLAGMYRAGSGAGATDKALVVGALDAAYSALGSDMGVAFQSTHQGSLRPTISGSLGELMATQAVLDKSAASSSATDWAALEGRIQQAAADFGPAAMTGLDRILGARAASHAATERSAEEGAIAREEHHSLEGAIATLSEDDREVITLYYVQKHTTKEIAEVMGVAPGTIMARLFRAREKLRNKMQEAAR